MASSVGVATGPPAGFALAAVGGIALDFAVVTVLSVIVAGLDDGAANAARHARACPADSDARGAAHAIPASIALIITTMGHTAVYAFLPMHAAAARPWQRGVVLPAHVRLHDRQPAASCDAPPISSGGRACWCRPWSPSRLGTALLALPPTIASLIAAAVLLGTGNSMLYPTLVALVVDRAPLSERGLAIGTVSGAWDRGRVHRLALRCAARAGPRLLRGFSGQRPGRRPRPRHVPRDRARLPALDRPRDSR